MTSAAIHGVTDRVTGWLTTRRLLIIFLVGNAELAVVAGYELLARSTVVDPFAVLVPWIWINAAIGGVAWGPRAGRRRTVVAVAAGYGLVLAVFGGVIGPGESGGLAVHWIAPGYGPAVLYTGEPLAVRVIPYRVIGYAALALLVGRAVADASVTGLSGVLGILTCISCSWPILAAMLATLGGSTAGLAALTTPWFGTAAFLIAVALLTWRPSIGATSRLRDR